MANTEVLVKLANTVSARAFRDRCLGLLCAVLVICSVLFTWDLHRTNEVACLAIQDTNAQINRSLLPVLAQDLDRVATSAENVSDAVGDVRKSIISDVAPALVTDLDNVTGSVSRVAGSIDKTRTQLDRLIIITGGAVGNIEKATRDLDDQESAQIAYLNSTAANMSKLTADADKLVSDPELAATLKNLSVTTKNLGEVSENFSKLSDFYYKKLTSPVSLAKVVAQGAGGYAAKFAGALVGTWH